MFVILDKICIKNLTHPKLVRASVQELVFYQRFYCRYCRTVEDLAIRKIVVLKGRLEVLFEILANF